MKSYVFVSIVVTALLSGFLQAADTVISFDESAVTNQLVSGFYHSKGVDFLSTDITGAGIPLPGVMAAAGAHSPPNVASIRGFCSTEFCTNAIRGQFTSSTTHIRVSVGSFAPNTETAVATLSGYNGAGKLVAKTSATVIGSTGFNTALDVSLPIFAPTTDAIVYFQVTSDLNKHVAIDDLTFDAQTAAGPPDFTIAWNAGGGLPVQLTRGGKNSTTIRVSRSGTSTGSITLAAGTVPAGVNVVSISPNPTTGPGTDGTETVTVTISADDSALPGTGSITINAAPSSTAGSAPRSTTISVSVRDSFDARVVGIEVTQSIQSIDLPQKNALGASVPYGGGTSNNPIDAAGVQCPEDIATPGRILQDHGVALAEGGKTIVRVFANLRIRTLSATLPAIEAALFVCDSAGSVCSPAIKPDGPPLVLGRGPNKVCRGSRTDPTAAYVFTLDNKLAKGTVSLKAQVFPPTFFSSDVAECTDAECADNNTFVLSGISFTKTVEIQLAPIELVVHCGFGADPKGCVGVQHPAYAFAQAINVAPLAVGGIRVPDYVGSIEIGDIIDKDSSATDRGDMVVSRLIDRAEDWNDFDTNQLVIGVYPDTFGSAVRGVAQTPASRACSGDTCIGAGGSAGTSPCDKSLYCPDKAAIVTGPPRPYIPDPKTIRFTTTRPLTSDAHELFHLFGRFHAGRDCDGTGDRTDPWPPDFRGYIQGYGLNRRNGFYSSLYSSPGPYVSVPADLLTVNYDFMSYCASEGNSWISVPGWNLTIANLKAGGFAGSSASPEGTSQAPATQAVVNTVPVLLVRAIKLSSGSIVITKVGPATAAALNDPPYSNYHLIARAPTGAILSDTVMTAEEGHPEPGVESLFLSGRTTAVNATSLEVQLNGNIVASRSRPANAPVVKLIAPPTGATVGLSNNTLVQWTTSAPSATGLMAKVDYSVDRGQTWKPLYFGPDLGQVSLAGSLFTTASCGMARVRINDGFNEATAVSGCFTALGSPPVVRILDPAAGTTLMNNSTLVLSGEAYEETGKPLSDQQLTWSFGDQPLGAGRSVSVTGLSPGTTRIVLMATDSRGRSSTASLLLVCGNGQVDKSCVIQTDNRVTGPLIANAGIGNAASYETSAVSPGEIVTLFGSELGPTQTVGLTVHNGVVDSVLDDTAVLFDDKPAPLIYVLANQISAIVPYSVNKPSTQIQVVRKGFRSNAVSIPVVDAVPGIFTSTSSGVGQGAIINQDGNINGPSHPAPRGTIVAIFATGEGQTSPPGIDGKLAVDVYPKPLLPVTATIGGRQASVLYYGAAPSLVLGVLQVNARVPDEAPSGNVPLLLQVGTAVSRTGVTVAVQ